LISRILCGRSFLLPDRHQSNAARPLTGWPDATFIWSLAHSPCTTLGLHRCPLLDKRVGSYPTISPLPGFRLRPCIFCCTIPSPLIFKPQKKKA